MGSVGSKGTIFLIQQKVKICHFIKLSLPRFPRLPNKCIPCWRMVFVAFIRRLQEEPRLIIGLSWQHD